MNALKAVGLLVALGVAFCAVLVATFYPLILAFAGLKYLIA